MAAIKVQDKIVSDFSKNLEVSRIYNHMKSKVLLLMLGTTFLWGSCGRISEGTATSEKLIPLTVTADFETEALKNPSKNDDAADDPAVWVNKENPERSFIIGTDKTAGLAVYDLSGKELFFYPDGRMNNVDVRYSFPYKGREIDIVACSNRTTRSVNLYQIHKNGSLTKLPTKGFASPMEGNVYGFALGTTKANFYAYVNSKKGEVVQWQFVAEGNVVNAKIVRQMNLGKQLEGMVADDITGTLFIGAEEQAIWYTTIVPSKQQPQMVKESDLSKNMYMKEDIEGLAIYRASAQQYLLASSQGNYSYAVFDLNPPYNYIGSFRIVDGAVDGVQETDGIEAVSISLGSQFPEGVFLAQDGFNKDNGKLKPQNFKVVDWRKVSRLIRQMENNRKVRK